MSAIVSHEEEHEGDANGQALDTEEDNEDTSNNGGVHDKKGRRTFYGVGTQ